MVLRFFVGLGCDACCRYSARIVGVDCLTAGCAAVLTLRALADFAVLLLPLPMGCFQDVVFLAGLENQARCPSCKQDPNARLHRWRPLGDRRTRLMPLFVRLRVPRWDFPRSRWMFGIAVM
jgi:hypothetical protein